MSETLGKWHFWLFFIGCHVTFDTMHFLGLLGMPRSIYTYQPDRGWNLLNLVVSIGGLIQGIAVLISAYNFIRSYWRGEAAGDDPWDALDPGMGHLVSTSCLQLRGAAGSA